MAAVLALGAGAVVSHRSAAAIWGLLSPARGPIDVTVPGDGGRRKRGGIVIHRSSTLVAGVSTRRSGVPLTTPARTIRDLRRSVPQPVFQRAVRRALDLRLIAHTDLDREPDLTRSELERRFLSVCRRHRLPQPEVNARIGPYEVDFLWRDSRVVAETDGFRFHGDRLAFERDRARDAELQAHGYVVLRFTYRQVREAPGIVAAHLGAVIGR
jgi:very-short-patch-repair endonuclease